MNFIRILLLPIVIVASAASIPASSHSFESTDSPETPHALDRIAIIGASASAGWGLVLRYIDEEDMVVTRLVTLNDVLQACIQRDETIVRLQGSGMFFWNPERVGEKQATEALAEDPTLLVAIDYLFWFGYGNRGVDGRRIPFGSDGHEARLELLEKGLAELEEFDCPMLVGDFPDMSEAVGYMLGESQMPAPETLKALNRRLREWANEHTNVTIVSLADLTNAMKSDKPFEAGRQQWPAGSRKQFMQRDNLHPTLDGLIILTQESMATILDQNTVTDGHCIDFELESVRNRIYENNQPEGTTPKPYTAED
ncbi:MAG: hypothetical protein CMJ40_02250 [Phycisphaerae bacterium]|nr:hypothetical protein [Phycisphaerae bacterium]|tara:strand:+ start:1970 stop:2902 length:933 start_codon:yes stop_codon:yes gene_type:complete